MGNQETLARTGRSVILRTAAISIAICIGIIGLVQPFVHLRYSHAAQGNAEQLKAVSQVVFDILPSDPVEPFRIGNYIQIIVIALFIGTGLLAIGERGERIRGLIEDSDALMQQIVSAVSALVPLFVFAILLRQIWLGEAEILVSTWKPVVLVIVSYVAVSTIIWLISAMQLKCSPIKLLKLVFPPALIGFTTASSLSAMALSMETCEKKLGVQKKLVSLLYPMNSMLYQPLSVVYFTMIVFSFAEMYGLQISLTWMITAGILCLLLSVAVPPVPGSGLMVYSILFSSLGLPSDAVMVATAIEMVSDHLYTGCMIALQHFRVACEADRMGYLDRTVLNSSLAR